MTLGAWCSGHGCDHYSVVDVERYGDDVPVPWFGPRLRCERCGHLGADARPNWSETTAPGRDQPFSSRLSRCAAKFTNMGAFIGGGANSGA
jgi:hypothetical protein